MNKKKATKTVYKQATKATYLLPEKRYETFSKLWANGNINSFQEIFAHIPPFVVRIELGMGKKALEKRIEEPKEFTVKQIEKMAELFKIDYLELLMLIASC